MRAALLLVICAACEPSAAPPPAAAPVTVLSRDPLVVEVRIGSDDRMVYDFDAFEVPAGAEVHLAFSNRAQRPMLHNWVLVRRGSEEEILHLGLVAGYERDWVPAHPGVLAATRALRPGEAQMIVFQAGEPGVKPYVCTVPGHAAMRGRMTVRGAPARR